MNTLDSEFIEVQTGGFGRWGIPGHHCGAQSASGLRLSIIELLTAGMTQAAKRGSDPEQKRQVLTAARELGAPAKAIAVNVASETLKRRFPH